MPIILEHFISESDQGLSGALSYLAASSERFNARFKGAA
ncbi:hypothetical protein ACP70R_007726 [Stipagrostis hirtigluma subsp. patula]